VIEVVQNQSSYVFELLLFAIGITAITFIAIILFLNIQETPEPVQLPRRDMP
jgi:hypothetical protein